MIQKDDNCRQAVTVARHLLYKTRQLKTGKAKAIRFSTPEAIRKALNCQPGDILEFVE